MPSLLPLLLLATATAIVYSFTCGSNFDCQLNGVCEGGTHCVCRPGWKGPDCGILDLLPAPTTPAFYRNTSASWGGSVIEEGGKYYMFLAFMEGHCGLNAWQPNSAIYRAVSSTTSPLGPYIEETLVLPWFSHNPTVSKQLDGSILVWHIGDGSAQGKFNQNCSGGVTPPPPPPPPVHLRGAGGACLVANGTFPCWIGGGGYNFHLCPLVVGDCALPSALWGVGEGVISSALGPGLGINIDCNTCTTGTPAKLLNGSSSGLEYNSTSQQIHVTSCPGMCLTVGGVGGTRPPCGGGTEPWTPEQIHVAPCNSSTTMGWVRSSSGGGGGSEVWGGGVQSAFAAPLLGPLAWPAPPTDVNAMMSTSGVLGPFVDTGMFQGPRDACFPWESDNPAPLVFPNGSTWVMYRSWHPPTPNCTTPIGIARSDGLTWNTTYTHGAAPIPRGFHNESSFPPRYIPLEDPFLFLDKVGNFHALFHNMGGCKEVGCHAFSEDGWTWYLATSDPYTTLVEFEDGSSHTFARRERPHLVFNQDGDPAFLTNGMQLAWSNDHSFTQVQQINVPWP